MICKTLVSVFDDVLRTRSLSVTTSFRERVCEGHHHFEDSDSTFSGVVVGKQ